MRFFDAHDHLQNYGSAAELEAALAAAAMLCCATRPGDWDRVLEIGAAHSGVVPCFGVHPWFSAEAAGGWLEKLEDLLRRAPGCAGEIGLDGARDTPRQDEVFRAQLGLAKKLERPAVIHCVRAWGRLLRALREGAPPRFMLHAYSGAPELVKDLAALGGYFSFGGELADPRREKLRAALAAVPRGRLLFETDSPAPGAGARLTGPARIAEVVAAAAAVLGVPAEELAELSYANGREFLSGRTK